MAVQHALEAPFPMNFGRGAPYTVGAEEELFLVDPLHHQISRVTDELLARRGRFARGQVLGEMCDGVVELASPVCSHAGDAATRLRSLRASALAPGSAALMGVGVHPTAPFGAVAHRPQPHYAAVGEDTRGLLRQSAYCGVHVHVGMPDAETAITAFNGMRKWIPLLQALSANSPFWHGRDSGLASTRTVICHSVPRTGLPRAFRDWADYEHTVSELIRVSGIDGPGSIWWDMRPHPTLGTLEVRCLDAQSSIEDLEALVALVHCLVHHEAVTGDPRHPEKEILEEACYRGIRDGLDARLSTGGPMHHVQHLARDAMDLASGYAGGLGCTDALQGLERLLAEGNGAVRQRRAYAAGGFPAVLRGLVAETCDVSHERAA
jgi:glutamate---cysteine ligase / carboxylate-amine ligase